MAQRTKTSFIASSVDSLQTDETIEQNKSEKNKKGLSGLIEYSLHFLTS
jgi:hypothetical protein